MYWWFVDEIIPSAENFCYFLLEMDQLKDMMLGVFTELWEWFDGQNDLPSLQQKPTAKTNLEFICAITVFKCIGENADYLASLIDVEECLSR